MKKILAIIVFTIFTEINYSQLSNLQVAKSFEDAATREDPAAVTFSKAKDKSATWVVDAAAQYKVGTSAHNIITEYHRNTAADAEINNFQFGYSGKWVVHSWYGTPRINATLLMFFPQLKYRYDDVEGSHGVAGSFLFSLFQQGPAHKFFWSNWKYSNPATQKLGYRLEPTLGAEFQQNFKAKSTIYNGFVGRAVAGLNFRIGAFVHNTLSPNKPDKKFIFSLSGTLRYDAVGKEYTDSRLHPLLFTAADWYIISAPISVALGASFKYGDNPKEGFRKFEFKSQQLWEIGLKFQTGN